jgi:hypothetical protein
MNTTIAVAIITALATTAGAGIAAVFSLMNQSRQSKLQEEAQRRQIRRDAYVSFLTKFDEMSSIYDTVWNAPVSDDPFNPVVEPIDQTVLFRIALAIVQLEGPEAVSKAAQGLVYALDQESRQVDELADQKVGESAKFQDFVDMDQLIEKRNSAKKRFIDEAAKALL